MSLIESVQVDVRRPRTGRGLHDIFESTADALPAAIALECGSTRLTYAEADRLANQLAHRLRTAGVCGGDFVAIHLGRSELPVLAVLACHKAGACYVPLDPGYPVDRMRHIADDLGVRVCLTEEELAGNAESAFGAAVLVLDTDDERDRRAALPDTRLPDGPPPDALAYAIYTSGTTGRPKGVLTEHRHVSLFVDAFNAVCATGPEDRVYQGFSLSFDGSVEEIWMAFSNGSALVVPDRDAPRFGEDLARHLTDLGITYFSTVPTLLATLESDVPSLRTLVLSGEVCRPELVSRWARPDLSLLNVYGPTEATVNTTVARCLPDRPVTIGTPLPGYRVEIVDDELNPLPQGETGELLVIGDTLARGYHNQPDLTGARFVDRDGVRCYRTGDLGRWNDDGELEFLGRADGQVKIRGYRVELSEIDAVLREHPSVLEATVSLVDRDGLPELAAYAVARDGDVDRNDVLALLESRLPAYMVPGYLDVLPELPRTTSGKIDRKALPDPVAALVRVSTGRVPPETELEAAVAQVWCEVFGVAEVSIEDDFFRDLGGHSLLAARMVTLVRERTGYQPSVRLVYELPTVRAFAARLAESAPEPSEEVERREIVPTSRWRHRLTGLAQAISLYFVTAPVSFPLTGLLLLSVSWYQGGTTLLELALWSAVLAVGTWPALLILSIVAKWVIIGRYRPGTHRLWGLYYWRWWLTNRIGALSGAAVLAGTPLLPLYYRLMGAKVGRGCTLDTVHCSAWDLVSIGDDTSIGADTHLLGYRVADGLLHLGRVDIGDRCFVGIHSALGLGVRMSDDSALEDQTLLPDGHTTEPGAHLLGSPPEPTDGTLPANTRQSGPRRLAMAIAHLVASYLIAFLVAGVPVVVLFAVTWLTYTLGGWGLAITTVVAMLPVEIVVYCCYIALLKRLMTAGLRPGTYPVLGWTYLRKWCSDGIMVFCRTALQPVYTTIYLPPLLRLMGARIGRGAEISTVWSFAPELIDVAEESFFADGSIIGGRRCHRGTMELAVNRIGRRSFVGNGAVLPVGGGLADNCLLGVQSIPPKTVPDDSEWLGSPAFRLHHRVKVGNFDSEVLFTPTRKLYAQRLLIDGLRVLIPYLLLTATGILMLAGLVAVNTTYGPLWAFLVSPIALFAAGLLGSLGVVALKWAVMGRFRPEIKPLWSVYVWLNEMVNGAFISVMTPAIQPLLGTPFAAPMFRALGCRVGRQTYLNTTLFSEFDLIEIGDRAALNYGSVVQNHLFEDRVFKSSHQRLAADTTLANMSIALYDSEVGEGVYIGPLSLLMKGETLSPHTTWQGIPTQRGLGLAPADRRSRE